MIIPGWLIAAVTFPGIVVHEAAHMLMCRLCGVAVLDVKFLQMANPPGYVIHEIPQSYAANFLIGMGPFFVNTALCLLICFPAFLSTRIFHLDDPFSYALLWLGVSIGMHAFPSNQDASSLWRHGIEAAKRAHPLAILSLPLVILVYVANVGRFFWLDYAYGLAIGIGLPSILLERLAKA